MRGSGTDAGRAFTIDGSIVTLNSDISSLSMWYDDDRATLIYETDVVSTAEFEISGNDVMLTAQFTGADGVGRGRQPEQHVSLTPARARGVRPRRRRDRAIHLHRAHQDAAERVPDVSDGLTVSVTA